MMVGRKAGAIRGSALRQDRGGGFEIGSGIDFRNCPVGQATSFSSPTFWQQVSRRPEARTRNYSAAWADARNSIRATIFAPISSATSGSAFNSVSVRARGSGLPVFMKRLDIQLQSLRRIAQGLVDIIACRGTARKVREPDANGPVRPCILNDGDVVSHGDLSQASSLRPYKWHGQVPFPSPSWGDVPGLDRSQSKPLGWLRQAGASILKLTVVVWIVFCDLHEPNSWRGYKPS